VRLPKSAEVFEDLLRRHPALRHAFLDAAATDILGINARASLSGRADRALEDARLSSDSAAPVRRAPMSSHERDGAVSGAARGFGRSRSIFVRYAARRPGLLVAFLVIGFIVGIAYHLLMDPSAERDLAN
jgi:hypothetical protein